jgi:long-chain fatty acid transport protein
MHAHILTQRFVAAACLTVMAAWVSAQELEIAVSPSPVGSGARAAGMADAFVAIADDATAASWNPAGLVQLERPEISIVGSYNALFEEFNASGHPESESRHDADSLDLNFLSVVYPIPPLILGRNATVALSYQRKYDFTRDFDIGLNTSRMFSDGSSLSLMRNIDFKQSGGLSTISPSFAIELTNRISIGASLNLWRSSFLADSGWEQDSVSTVRSEFTEPELKVTEISMASRESNAQYKDFEGENVSLGVLWNPTDKWTLAARFDSGFTGDATFKSVTTLTEDGVTMPPISLRESRDIRFPESYALGVAYRANDRLTLSLDVTTADWNDFYFTDGEGTRISLIDASGADGDRSHFDRTYTVRFGAEHVFIPKQMPETLDKLWTLRGGLFYDEEPATGSPDQFYGFALGVGFLYKQRINFDLAYQLRYGNGVNGDLIRGVPGFDEDVVQHRVLASAVIYF